MPKRSRVLYSDDEAEFINKKSKTVSIESSKVNNIDEVVNIDKTYVIDRTWVSASSTRNFLLKDPLLDWLDEHYCNLMTHSETDNSAGVTVEAKFAKDSSFGDIKSSVQNAIKSKLQNTGFTPFIMNQGNEFEKMIIIKLFKKFSKNVIDIGGSHANGSNVELAEKTRKHMSIGTPIIYQGVLHDPETKTFGVPDLIVRSDWLRNLVSVMPIETYNEIQSATNFIDPITREHVKWHYRIVDIKFMTLPLRSDGVHLLNVCSIKAYKGQMFIYNRILSKIQGYDPKVSYLLGRKWKYTCKELVYKGDSPFDRLGRIAFGGVDQEFTTITDQAVAWVRDMRREGHLWGESIISCDKTVILPRVELYPNISNYCDFPWHDVKKKIAVNLDEITMLWMCGPKNRDAAFKNGIHRWSDAKCDPSSLNIFGEKTSRVLNEILNINKQPTTKINESGDVVSCKFDMVRPAKIVDNTREWRTNYPTGDYSNNNRKVEFYVDMETISDVVSNVNTKCEYSNILFMIGVGYIDRNGVWKYRDFTLDELKVENEKKMCEDFAHYIKAISEEYGCEDPLLVHWSRAEPGLWDVVMNFDNYEDSYDLAHSIHNIADGWFDLLKVFKSEPIVVKGCLSGFGLKDIATSLYKNKLISTKWEGNVANGIDAMIFAYRAYQDAASRRVSVKDINIMTEIVKYNEVDCKVLYEIITHLRLHHNH